MAQHVRLKVDELVRPQLFSIKVKLNAICALGESRRRRPIIHEIENRAAAKMHGQLGNGSPQLGQCKFFLNNPLNGFETRVAPPTSVCFAVENPNFYVRMNLREAK